MSSAKWIPLSKLASRCGACGDLFTVLCMELAPQERNAPMRLTFEWTAGLVLNIFLAILPLILSVMSRQQVRACAGHFVA